MTEEDEHPDGTDDRPRLVHAVLSDAPRRSPSPSALQLCLACDVFLHGQDAPFVVMRFHGHRWAFYRFAQDLQISRGAYRALQDSGVRTLRAGAGVEINISPGTEQGSRYRGWSKPCGESDDRR